MTSPVDKIPQSEALRKSDASSEEKYYMASQTQLMARKFRKHKLAVVALVFLLFFYLVAFTYEFWAPYGALTEHKDRYTMEPTVIRLTDDSGNFIGPFVYGLAQETDMETFKRVTVEDKDSIHKFSKPRK